MTLELGVVDKIFSLLGKRIEKGENETVNIILNNQTFEAKLYSNAAKARKEDQLQIRYSKEQPISKQARAVFSDAATKLFNEKGGALKGAKVNDYFDIYAINSNTYMFDCHYRLTKEEFNLCGDNFSYLAAAKSKPFLILGGFSGTGKSQKVKELAYLTCPNLDDLQKGQDPGNYCLISVKPNWHDSTELLGYYSNIGKKYVVTDFMKILVKAMRYPLVPFYVCMDEMNLAPVEEYFAEYLSVLESRKKDVYRVVSGALISKDVFKDEAIFDALNLTDDNRDREIKEELREHGLRLPQNITVIGTVNMDDTTNSFSRKVIDRAMTFETKIEDISTASFFSLDNDALEYKNIACPERFICKEVKVHDLLKDETPDFHLLTEEKENHKLFTDFINEVNKAIGNGKNYDKKEGLGVSPFQVSYRVLNETVLYYRSLKVLYPEQASFDKVFNDILMMKILPRIEGEQDRAKAPLEGLQQFVALRCGDDEKKKALWKDSADKIAYMLRPFQRGGDGFTTFWQ